MPILVVMPLIGAVSLEIQSKRNDKTSLKLFLNGGKLMNSLVVMYYMVVMGACGVSSVICIY